MFSREARMKAIKLYLKYGECSTAVRRKLGYPKDHETLKRWYMDYLKEQETGIEWKRKKLEPKYSLAQKQVAVEHFLEHGHNISRTVRMLGYPARETLRSWCEELSPWTRKKQIGGIQYPSEYKQKAVIDLYARTGSAKEIANDYGVSRETLYKWRDSLFRKDPHVPMKRNKKDKLPDDKKALLSELDSLKKDIKKLQMEKAIIEGAAELIKKDQGVSLKYLTNKEKTILIDALRAEYPLKELLNTLEIAKSSYFYHFKALSLPDKYEDHRAHIIRIFAENKSCYGYRRINALLKRKGIRVSEKVVRRLMAETGLVVTQRKKKKYSSYKGENQYSSDNLIKRNFHADAPNEKWLTDITEFGIPAGKVYLSPVVDCFDGLLPSWTISTKPDADTVNSMLDSALGILKPGEKPIIHSDRGFQYRWHGWISRIERNGLRHSMSSKGCPPDNAACEGLFGRIKNEMFYDRSWAGVSIEDFISILNEYLNWYNEKRIKMSLGAMSPLEYRNSLGMAV